MESDREASPLCRDHDLVGACLVCADRHGAQQQQRISQTARFDARADDSRYVDLARNGFRDYKLIVDGAVQRRGVFPLAMLERLCNSTQITRHDCVEGWSVVAKWSGVRLSSILDLVQPRSDARYVVFHCLDKDDQGTPYYESLDMHQARHPQALLAMRMNNQPISTDHGAPVRLKVPTQLGYKSAKWIGRIEVVGSYANLYAGGGGYWEDQGYEWYAGI